MTFRLTDLAVPIAGAPMAGGPSTPALAAAVADAGALGFLAGGYLSAERLAEDIAAVRARSSGPVGVNLFVPQPSVAEPAALAGYADLLAPLAARYGVAVGAPGFDDDGWREKLEVLADTRPEVASFTFGTPEREVLDRLRGCGILTLVTVTCEDEAERAEAAGADALVVQGPGAGGHRGTFDPAAQPGDEPLEVLLEQIGAAHDVPLIAAGGLGDAAAVAGVLRRGAVAAQVGTALLLADEAGTNPTHRAALRDPRYTRTAATRAFSGRYARGLVNAFTDRCAAAAPPGYPEINRMTSPIRRAAAAAGDPDGTSLWAGVAHAGIRSGPAAGIVADLAQ